MISSATVQSAIVLMNRRMNAERDVTTFVPGCSRLTGMDLHHPQGMNRAQAQMSRVSAYAQSSTVTGYTGIADGEEDWGSRSSTLRFCLYRRQWRGGTSASLCVPWRRRAPPSNESEERTPKAPSGESAAIF